MVALAGRSLAEYPVATLRAVLEEVVVVAKRDTRLPDMAGVARWVEPDEPRHPLAGLLHALHRAGGRAVLACGVDLPLVPVELVRRLIDGRASGAMAAVAAHAGELQPLLGLYEPAALPPLARAGRDPDVALRDAVAALEPTVVDAPDGDALLNVNEPEDLRRAEALLARS